MGANFRTNKELTITWCRSHYRIKPLLNSFLRQVVHSCFISHSTESIISKLQNSVKHLFYLVWVAGFEPAASHFQGGSSTRLTIHPDKFVSPVFKRTFTTQRKTLYLKLKTLSILFLLLKKQNPETLRASGFVYNLLTITIYTQTSDTGAHELLSHVNVRYSEPCFVMCISLFILVYIQPWSKKWG